MTLEQQVCSLEPARRLKELGVNQESYFAWHSAIPGVEKLDSRYLIGQYPGLTTYAAFTASELLHLLPGAIKTRHGSANLTYIRILSTQEHLFDYTYATPDIWDDTTAVGAQYESTNAANNLAFLLIYLIENKLITLP